MSLRRKIFEAGSFVIYLCLKFLNGPGLFLTGCRKIRIGTCTIIAPLNKIPLIQQGFIYLKTIDLEMYERLTTEKPFTFIYIKRLPLSQKRSKPIREIDFITDDFMNYGNEGVAVYLLQRFLYNNWDLYTMLQ